MTGKRKAAGGARPIVLDAEKGETETESMTRAMVGPYLRHGVVAKGLADKMTGKLPGDPQLDDYGRAIKAKADLARKGDMRDIIFGHDQAAARIFVQSMHDAGSGDAADPA